MQAPPGLEIRGTKSPQGSLPPTKGRGLFSTKTFEPGDLIALFDKPIFAIPDRYGTGQTCNNCLQPFRQPTKLCSACHVVAYCSPACQRTNWTRYHKFECKPLQRAIESAASNLIGEHAVSVLAADSTSVIPDADMDRVQIPAPVRALILTMMRYEKDASIRAQIERLEDNTVAFVSQTRLWDDLKMQAAAACRFTNLESDEKIKMALEILCRIHTNAFDRNDPDVGTAGLYLDATLAMANHSCIPNAVVAFSGQKAFLRSTMPIAPGDEILISYTDFTKPRHERQQAFQLYNFQCACRRCADDLNVYDVCKLIASDPKTAPVVESNDRFTLVPDVEIMRNPPVLAPGAVPGPSAKEVEAIFDRCDIEANVDPTDRLAYMRKLWIECQPLIKAEHWAVEPLAALVRHTTIYLTEVNNYPHALALACYSAQYIDPYKYPEPFSQWRIKGLIVIAKLVPHIMPIVHPQQAYDSGRAHKEAIGQLRGGDPRKKVLPAVLEALPDLADGGIYEALMLMALEQGPKGHSNEWATLGAAQLMLDDVRRGPGHGPVTRALAQWYAAPTSPSMKAFFDRTFMNAINTLSSLAITIIKDILE